MHRFQRKIQNFTAGAQSLLMHTNSTNHNEWTPQCQIIKTNEEHYVTRTSSPYDTNTSSKFSTLTQNLRSKIQAVHITAEYDDFLDSNKYTVKIRTENQRQEILAEWNMQQPSTNTMRHKLNNRTQKIRIKT